MYPGQVILSALLPCISLLGLLLLLLLGSALSLPFEPLILMLDLGRAIFGFSAAASPINHQPTTSPTCRKTYTHVNSTLILLAGDFPSSNDEWWYSFRHDFMRSKFSNSTKPKPRHFSGWLRSVATRTEDGGFFAKWAVTEATFAVKGRFPCPRLVLYTRS